MGRPKKGNGDGELPSVSNRAVVIEDAFIRKQTISTRTHKTEADAHEVEHKVIHVLVIEYSRGEVADALANLQKGPVWIKISPEQMKLEI